MGKGPPHHFWSFLSLTSLCFLGSWQNPSSLGPWLPATLMPSALGTRTPRLKKQGTKGQEESPLWTVSLLESLCPSPMCL